MADDSTKPDLAELVANALQHIPADKAKEIAAHPDTPAAITKLREALGLGQPSDVMSLNEQAAAKEAGIPTIAHPEFGADSNSSTSSVDDESRIRNQAISDLAVAASKSKPSTPNSKQIDLFHGLIDMGAKAMKKTVTETASKLQELEAAVKDAQSISKGTK